MRPYSGQARAGKAPPRSSGGEPADASNVAFFLPTSVGARGGGGQAAGGGGAGFSDLKFIPLAKGPAPRARGSAALRVTRPASQPRADAADAWDGARAHSPGGGGRRFSSPLVANNREDLQRELQYSLHEALGAATGGSRARGASAGRAQRPHSGSDGAGAWARASVPSTPSAPGTAGRRSGVRTPGGGADATRASLANPYLAARPAAASDRPLEKPVRHKMGGAKAAAPLARAAGAAGKRAAAPAAPAGAARAAPVPTALPSSQLDDALAQLRLFTAGGGGGRDGRDAGAATDARMTDSERVATAARAQAGGRSARTSEGLADGVAEPLRPGVTKHTDQFDLWIAPPTPASGARPPHLAPPAAPTSSASEAGGESAEELRARLAMAEAVMRKLYRRTAQLEERLSTSEAREDGAARPPPSSAAAAAAHGVAAHARRPASAGGGLLSATGTADPAVDADASDAGADGADGGGASRARAALDEHALYLLESHESKAAEMEASLGAMAAHARALEAKLLQSQAVGDEVSSLRVAIAAAHDERAQLSDRYARMKTEQRTLLRSRVAGIRGASKAGVAREAATLISELEAHLALERRENAAHARELNERLYQQEQRQCDMYVEKRLLEQKVVALSGQIDARDRLETSIEARMFSLFGRLQQLEDTNLQLEVQQEARRDEVVVAS